MLNKKSLYKAVELAKNPGECVYVLGKTPCCVVAQYLVLEKLATIDKMSTWHSSTGLNDESISNCIVDGLDGDDYSLLQLLQNIWDRPVDKLTIDQRRAQMIKEIDSFFFKENKL